ncbi:asparaginase domain-containing protein [Wenyingzhuangia sp. IMCC45574]
MKLLLIYTGGTIGMEKDSKTGALKPGAIHVIQSCVASEFKDAAINYIQTEQLIDSSNFNLKAYQELATIVDNNYNTYDAFLVLMGTDTMSYISSLLSYCIQGLSKPIVFTGGQLPLVAKESDSKENLVGAVSGLLNDEFPIEVGIYFYKKWMRAVLTSKIHTDNFDAYRELKTNKTSINLSTKRFEIVNKIESEFMILKFSPFYNHNFLKKILAIQSLNGIILEGFGSGNLPDFDDELLSLFKKRISQGFRVVVVTQCLRGGVTFGKYETSLKAGKLGFISGGELTTESALAKMMYLSTKELNCQEYQRFFAESMRGE